MTDRDYTPDELARQAYAAAIRLLSSRDHSVAELTRKLEKREHGHEAIESALQELMELNYVNDQRYALTYAEQRVDRGYGHQAIDSRLRERGIDRALIREAIDNLSIDWSELAQSVIQRRFNADQILDKQQKTESKISRFLVHRGFTGRDSLRALQAARKELLANS